MTAKTEKGTLRMIPGGAMPPAPIPVDFDALARGAAALGPAPEPQPAPANEKLQPGDRVGPYLVVGPLGDGGMSHVVEVRHVHLGQSFALKHLNARARGRPPLVDRFVAEGKVLVHLRAHAGVVEVQEVGEDARIGPFVVMEKLGGKTLRRTHEDVLKRGERMHPQVVLYIIISLAQTLHDVHQFAIIHRDLKPDNVQIVPRARTQGFATKVLDFGASKSQFNATTSLAEHAVATPAYMSPEQALRRRVAAASDQYSLALIAYELFSGRHAFADGFEENPGRVDLAMLWQVNAAIPLLPGAVVPRALAEVIGRALSKDPRDRFPSMRAFADALRGFVEPMKQDTPISVPARRTDQPYRPTVVSKYRRAGAPPPSAKRAVTAEVRDPKRAVDVHTMIDEPSLVVLVPEDLRGRRIVLGTDGVIGREGQDADVVLGHHTVSARHARYTRIIDDGGAPVFAFEDLESLNGSFVGSGHQVSAGLLPVLDIVPVKAYDLIGLGDVVAMLLPAGGFRGPGMTGFSPMLSTRPLGSDDDVRSAVDLADQAAAIVPGSTEPSGMPRWQAILLAVSALMLAYMIGAILLERFTGIRIPPFQS